MPVEKRYPRVMMTTALIPWTHDFQFDEELFRKQLRHIISNGIKHVYIFGTAGEGYDLNTEEYTRITRVFKEEMSAPDLHPMVCVISVSTQLIIERIKIAYDIGIREFQIVLPCWGIVDDNEMMKYFHTVCDRFPDCKFMIYNIERSGRVLGIREFQMIAEEIPNIVAAKYATPNILIINDILRSDCPIQFFLIDSGWAYGSCVGECGYLVAIAVPNPELAKAYYEAGLKRDYEALFRYDAELYDIRRHLIDTIGIAMDGTYDKMTLKLAIPEFPLRLRPPYSYPSEEDFFKHRDYIRKHYPNWKV